MFFVVRSNDSFNFPLEIIKYIVIVVTVCPLCDAISVYSLLCPLLPIVPNRWRQKSVRRDAGSSKSAETQLNKMLIVVSIIHVVSTLPSITKDVVKLVNPDFSLFGHYG